MSEEPDEVDTDLYDELPEEAPREWDPADLEIDFDENWWDEL
jgi:hypothetical protein